MNQPTDQTIICQNCGNEFVFSQGEQHFFAQKGLTPPTLCPICRSLKSAQQKFPSKPKST